MKDWTGNNKSMEDLKMTETKIKIIDEMPNTCANCPFSIENIEGDDENGYGVWYECKFIDGGAYPNEKLKDCPLREVKE